ncbi:hypothetical protein DITRI_Ditri13aG0087600 [Diplodiscus trichospermus]
MSSASGGDSQDVEAANMRIHNNKKVKTRATEMGVGSEETFERDNGTSSPPRLRFLRHISSAIDVTKLAMMCMSFALPVEMSMRRFPGLQMEYYDETFLLRIGQLIGKPLKMNTTTLSTARGRFMRVCMEVDLEKPLLSKFRFRRKVHRIEYEALHLVCFHCGRYGHQKEESPTMKESTEVTMEVQQESINVEKDMSMESNIEELEKEDDEGVISEATNSGKSFTSSASKGKDKVVTCTNPMFQAQGPMVAANMDHHVLVQGNNKSKSINKEVHASEGTRSRVSHHNNLHIPHPSVLDSGMDLDEGVLYGIGVIFYMSSGDTLYDIGGSGTLQSNPHF